MIVSKKVQGFTLIELVIVIILLGILAATALPKFSDLSGKAQDSANKGHKGALRDAVSMAHGIWLANGNAGAADIKYSETASGVDLGMNATGWPAGANGVSTLSTTTHCDSVWNVLMQQSLSEASYTSAVSGTTCTYTGPGSKTVTYASATGVVS